MDRAAVAQIVREELQRSQLASLVRQLQGALQGDLRVRGNVDSGGNVVRGKGFTASRTGLGRYDVVFATAFGETPTVILSWGDTAGGGGAEVYAESASGISVVTYNTAGVVLDNSFGFIALGPR